MDVVVAVAAVAVAAVAVAAVTAVSEAASASASAVSALHGVVGVTVPSVGAEAGKGLGGGEAFSLAGGTVGSGRGACALRGGGMPIHANARVHPGSASQGASKRWQNAWHTCSARVALFVDKHGLSRRERVCLAFGASLRHRTLHRNSTSCSFPNKNFHGSLCHGKTAVTLSHIQRQRGSCQPGTWCNAFNALIRKAITHCSLIVSLNVRGQI